MKQPMAIIATLFLLSTSSLTVANETTVTTLDTQYASQGATEPGNAARGEALWNQTFTVKGKERNCTLCHGSDISLAGKHKRTGKVIKPMAPSVNSERLSSVKKVEKWFKRNCKWTLGRLCTAQEKRDILHFIAAK